MTDLFVRLRRGEGSLREQVFLRLRDEIASGRLRRGDRLPPTRRLAAELGVGRLTVVDAYAQLVAEGYAEARQGAGTFVAVLAPTQASAPPAAPGASGRLSAWADGLARVVPAGEVTTDDPAPPRYDFRPGVVAWDRLDWGRWRRAADRAWGDAGFGDLWYAEPLGPVRLRRALAAWLGRSRAVRCAPEQVAVTAGAQQAFALLARLVLDPGDVACVENPGYRRAWLPLRAEGARLHPVAVDEQGARTDDLPPEARLLFVTPSHQYPLGVTMTVQRRLELLAWARRTGALVVEDDYDGELHLEGQRLESLQGLDGGGSVAYVGTLSKALFPSARLGFVVLPPPLVEPFRRARFALDRQPPWHAAAALARFLEEGDLERHVHRLRRVYRDRRDALVRALRRAFDGSDPGVQGEVGPCETGAHVAVRLPPGTDDVALARRAAAAGVGVGPLSPLYLAAPVPGLVLGIGGIEAADITDGVARLAGSMRAGADPRGC